MGAAEHIRHVRGKSFGDLHPSSEAVPISASGLRGEKPLADRAMWLREVGKTDA